MRRGDDQDHYGDGYEIEIIDLNITSTVHLAKRLLRDMAARDSGRLLSTSTMCGG